MKNYVKSECEKETVDTIKEPIDKLKDLIEIDEEGVEDLGALMYRVQTEMKIFKSPLNRLQMAVSTAAAAQTITGTKVYCKRHKRLIVQLPPAQGKTRVAIAYVVALSLLNAKQRKKTHVIVLHPTELLELQDEEQWKKVEDLIKHNYIELERTSSFREIKSRITKDTIFIVDEFDYVLFDKALTDPFELFHMKFKQLVAFTATMPSNFNDEFTDIFK